MQEGPPLKIKIDGSPGFAWNRRHLRQDTKQRTEECRISNRSLRRTQSCRMSKGGIAALCLFIKSTEYLPSTFYIRYSSVLRFAFSLSFYCSEVFDCGLWIISIWDFGLRIVKYGAKIRPFRFRPATNSLRFELRAEGVRVDF